VTTTPKLDKKKTLRPLASTIAALLIALGVNEGMRQTPYYDSVGVLTVCEGITGPDVIKGKHYSLLECHNLKARYVERMVKRLGVCLKVAISQEEWLAYGHASYNFGQGLFCKKFAPLINAGDNYGACAKLGKYVYARGRDCRVRSNNCYGVVTRREFERQMCESGLE
jgi:GH24 family phage-related lysozyme (muramidase)